MADSAARLSASDFLRRSLIGGGVAILHLAVIAALLLLRLAEIPLSSGENEVVLTLIPLSSVLPAKRVRNRRQSSSGQTGIGLPEYHWIVPREGNAIHITPYENSLANWCYNVLSPNSKEFKQLCGKLIARSRNGEYENFSVHTNPAFAHWEAEQKKHRAAYQAPCTYVRTDPATGIRSNMADLTCAAKNLFGGN